MKKAAASTTEITSGAMTPAVPQPLTEPEVTAKINKITATTS